MYRKLFFLTKDPSKGTNYHKVSEYLVYGRPIVSNYVSAYDFEGSGIVISKNYFEYVENIKKVCLCANRMYNINSLAVSYSICLKDILSVISAL
jgi:hypothetical protein